jgi:hypothetical protein
VVSFARAQTPDHEARGILTLWDRYTRNSGFCLQFRRSDVERRVEVEKMSFNYGVLEVIDVTYGIDESARDFLDMIPKSGNRFLEKDHAQTKNLDLDPIQSNWIKVSP